MDTLFHDLRFAVRTLSKSPLFTMVAVVSLAIGIGANTAVYTLIDALFLQSPAGVARADELVAFHRVQSPHNGRVWWEFSSYPDYIHYRDHSTGFSGLASHFEFTGIDSAAARKSRAA